MTVDMTINLGHIITLIGYIIAAVALYFGIRIDLTRKEGKIAEVHALATEGKEIAIAATKDVTDHVEKFHTTRGQ